VVVGGGHGQRKEGNKRWYCKGVDWAKGVIRRIKVKGVNQEKKVKDSDVERKPSGH